MMFQRLLDLPKNSEIVLCNSKELKDTGYYEDDDGSNYLTMINFNSGKREALSPPLVEEIIKLVRRYEKLYNHISEKYRDHKKELEGKLVSLAEELNDRFEVGIKEGRRLEREAQIANLRPRREVLKPEEKERVFELIDKGKSNREVAAMFGVHNTTIGNYLKKRESLKATKCR